MKVTIICKMISVILTVVKDMDSYERECRYSSITACSAMGPHD